MNTVANVNQNPIRLAITIDLDSFQVKGKPLDESISVSAMQDEAKPAGSANDRVAIKDMNLSTRLTNALINNGIKFKDQLIKQTMKDLQNIKGLGAKSYKELEGLISSNVTSEAVGKKVKTPAPAVSNKTFGDFELSNRALNTLNKAGITSPEQLSAMSNKEIKSLKGAGRKVFDEFEQIIGRSVYQTTGKVGRPAKSKKDDKVEATETTKRGRGRPRKVEAQEEPEKIVAVTEAPKRGRGRPRKTEVAQVEVIQTKRGRGRPPKAKQEETQVVALESEMSTLPFSTRTFNLLSTNGIDTIGKLKDLSIETVSSWKNAGKKVIGEISTYQGSIVSAEATKSEEKTTVSQGRGRPKQTVADLKLNKRTVNALEKNGIHFAKDLKKMTVEQLNALDGFSKNMVEDVMENVNMNSQPKTTSNNHVDISALELPTRTTRALINNGIKFVTDLKNKSDEELKTMKGLGATGLDKIHSALRKVA